MMPNTLPTSQRIIFNKSLNSYERCPLPLCINGTYYIFLGTCDYKYHIFRDFLSTPFTCSTKYAIIVPQDFWFKLINIYKEEFINNGKIFFSCMAEVNKMRGIVDQNFIDIVVYLITGVIKIEIIPQSYPFFPTSFYE